MKNHQLVYLSIFCLLLFHQSSVCQTHENKVLFLGNSITNAGTYIRDVEAFLMVHDRGKKSEFINAGLSSETVSGLSEEGHADGKFTRPDLHERLNRVLQQTKPDLVFACYGMNDGIYLPFDEGRFKKFRDGMQWLHEEVVKTGARIIHLTPPDYDEERGRKPGYAAVLDRYSAWLLSKKRTDNWEVIDIHTPMKKYLEAHRKVDRAFHLDGFALASDGVHPGETGHWIMAKQILLFLGHKQVARAPGILQCLTEVPNAAQFLKLVAQRQGLMKDAWLTGTGHKRPGLPVGLPLDQARLKSEELEREIETYLPK